MVTYQTSVKGSTKYFYNIKLTAQEYICNMAVCKAQDAEDVWFIANNISAPYAIREYKKRFDIEEMFRDFKSSGFNLEDTWTKDKKNKLLGSTKNIKGKNIRIYSLFSTGIKWFKRAYYSCRKKYYLKTCFTIYQG